MHDGLTIFGRQLNPMLKGVRAIVGQVQPANTHIATAAAKMLAAPTQPASPAVEQSAVLTLTPLTINEVVAISIQIAK